MANVHDAQNRHETVAEFACCLLNDDGVALEADVHGCLAKVRIDEIDVGWA